MRAIKEVFKHMNLKNKFRKIVSRLSGHIWGPYSEFLRNPHKYGFPLKSHIECQWTTPEHFAHDNYGRGHLPQLCIKASGWKAKLLAFILWPEAPYKPDHEYIVWWKNGDHPNDDVYRPYEDSGKIPNEPREGKVVRYFRHPTINGNTICNRCNKFTMHYHGWIDNGGEGQVVCPGDYVNVNCNSTIKL